MKAKDNPAKGKALIAEPFLGDPNFERSVILLCEHNDEGSFGFVLNQSTQITLQSVIAEDIYKEILLNIGGPVERNTLHFIHRLGEKIEDTVQISKDLYWAGNFEQVLSLLNLGKIEEKDIRFFLGYSGWSEGQLINEINENVWIVTDIAADFIFDTSPAEFWREILKKLGGDYKIKANYPIDPRLN